MKRISKKDEFLGKSIKKIDEFIYEEVANSGPFENDIMWGDSLIGRLINSSIRKAKVGGNIFRIKSVAKRLKDAFDELLGESVMAEMSEEQKKEYNKLIIAKFLEELERAVKEGKELVIIKNLTDSSIKSIEDFEDFEGKENVLEQLKKFREFLDTLSEEENKEEKKEENKQDSVDGIGEKEVGKEGEKSEKSPQFNFYIQTKKLLESVIGFDAVIKNKRVKEKEVKKPEIIRKAPKITIGKEYIYNHKIVKVVDLEKKRKAGKDERWLTTDDERLEKIEPRKVFIIWRDPTTKKYLANAQSKVVDPVELRNLEISESILENTAVLNGDETHARSAWKKIYNAYTKSGLDKEIDKIKEVIEKSKSGEKLEKKVIVAIGRQILTNETMWTDGKPMSFEELIKESGTIPSEYSGMAKSVTLFARIVLAIKEDMGILGALGESKKHIEQFIGSYGKMKELLPSIESKNESSVLKYRSFLRIINEADDTEETSTKSEEESIKTDEDEKTKDTSEVDEPEVMTNSKKIQDYWNKKMNLKSFVLSKTQVTKIKENFDKLEKDRQNNIVIIGMDPVLEIVKLFNRAYKIHTTQVISSGRTGGIVSNKTFMEYTCFGSGAPSNAGAGGGPYRNNAIFNQWENAVLNIKKDTKYQKIFRSETTLKTEEGKVIPKAGKNLGRFMVDMLDGDQLYKTGGGDGTQAKFLEKYFGFETKSPEDTHFGTKEEAAKESESNNKISGSIKSISLSFTKDLISIEKYSEMSKTFFVSTIEKEDGKTGQIYFYIQEVDDEYSYLVYSSTFHFFKRYIKESGTSLKSSIEKGDLPNSIIISKNSGTKEYIMRGFKIKNSDLISKSGEFLISGSRKIKYITRYDGLANKSDSNSKISKEDDNFKFKESYSLKKIVTVDGVSKSSRFKLEKDISNQIKSIGGFNNIKSDNFISNTYFEK